MAHLAQIACPQPHSITNHRTNNQQRHPRVRRIFHVFIPYQERVPCQRRGRMLGEVGGDGGREGEDRLGEGGVDVVEEGGHR